MEITDLHDDKEKVKLLNKLSKASLKTSSEKALDFGKQALELAKKINDNNTRAIALSNIGEIYQILGDYDEGLQFYQKALKIYEINSDRKYEAECLNNIGIIHRKLSNYNKALECFLKSLQIWNEIENKKGIAATFNNIGLVHWNLGNYENALNFYLKSLKIKDKIGNKKGIAAAYNNIGLVYWNLGNYENALSFYQKSLKIKKEIKDIKGLASSLNNIGLIYYEIGNYEFALEYYFKALKINEKMKNKNSIALLHNNIGEIYVKQNKFNNALECYQKSFRINEVIGNKNGLANTLTNIADLYLKLKNYDKAFTYLEQGLQLSREINAKDLIEESYELFSDLYIAKEDYRKALKYYKLYSEIKDSIYNEESSNKIAEMQTKYETEKKEREAEIFRLKNVELEEKVQIRSEELRKSNIQLHNEIIEHKKAEEQIKKDLEEKKILLQELFHRTKNNMQIISSMLKMQSQYSENEFVHSTFKTINNRIKAMSLVQQKLFQSKELSLINLKEYIEDILTQLRNSYIIKSKNISLKLDLKEVMVLIDSAVPLGLVLNELITNVYKYAFPDNRKGEIIIRLFKEETGTINIHLEDDGIGFPLDFEPEKAESIGFQTVFSLVKYQLHGEVNWTIQNGIKWHIKFKDDLHEKRV
ncbi:MAG: tetratricopeptide repeat protein [Candidatus Cloacimonetes bacterium]|nr:tetratricopeptide repeat protein [Candidatus Cloacimonadota bacterium]